MGGVKLAGFDLYRYELPLSEPLALKGMVLRHREGLLLELTGEGGTAGWGEASPLPGFSRESLDEAAVQLHDLAAPVVGREITNDWVDPNGNFSRELDTSAGLAPSVRFAFELAIWELYAVAHGRSLPEIMTPRPRATVPVNALIPDPPDKALEEARRVRSAGYEAVKLKVGGRTVEEDVELVRVLDEELGDAVALRLDANRAWSLEEAEWFVRTAGLRFEYIEEPLADPAQLPTFVRACGVPVALDESVVGMEPESLEDYGYVRAVVLKPTMLGGISRTLRFAKCASRLGMEPAISSAYETGVGTAALVALAAGVGDEEVPAGLDTYRRLAEDVLRPRLELPAPRVDVRVMAGTRREIERHLLRPVG